ncbi:UDP-glycosyltransferase 74F2-like [Pyrus x bretschneideri]|uniref:UDP-glycosyltransferase 74F2-like n=1 Tax=Pyrus x bretschneideri TaxID=225117 RepID=UPI00202DE81D|nr:UDP-glycosyltransferase 74F2-like [Pyrus x bretschneideri]
MGERHRDHKAHCLVFPYPTQQGHINPMLQFSKFLHHKEVKITLVTTLFAYNTILHKSSGLFGSYFSLETISDGYDQGDVKEAESVEAYLDRFKQVGSRTLAKLLEKLSRLSCPVDCFVYDAFIPWPLYVAKKFRIVGAVFFTQSCVVDNIHYHGYKGLLKLPLTKYDQSKILVPGLPPLEPWDLSSTLYDFGSYLAVYDIVVDQFSNVNKADFMSWKNMWWIGWPSLYH